jgi:hypothetical protein
MADALSDDELNQLVALLYRFATFELDQHEAWKLDTDYGPVYVTLSRALPAGHSDEAYRRLPERGSADQARMTAD